MCWKEVNVACSLIDNVGAPLRNTNLTFFVNFENRADTSWENGRKTTIKTTDSQGQAKAVLSAGNNVGSLGILVNYPGIYSSYTVLNVVAGSGSSAATTSASSTTNAVTASAATASTTAPTTASTNPGGTVPAAPTTSSTGYLPQSMAGGEGAPE